jgi:TRAP-type mannitol/chloroaromatic compound transport system permease large subunit
VITVAFLLVLVLGLLAGFAFSPRPLHLVQGMRIAPGPISDVFVGVMPFVLVYMVGVGILMLFPSIALWLPRVLQ